MDWNSPIRKDSGTVKDGEYSYVIVDTEQKVTRNTLKPMLEVRVKINLGGGHDMELRDWIVLSEETEWKVGQFLVSIGQKKRGEECIPDWSQRAIVGKRGRLKVKNRNDRAQITWLAPKKEEPQFANKENGETVSQKASQEKQDDFFEGFKEINTDERIPF